MSEHEFEAYLNLLARTLKLSETQRQRIAGELRDHFEERMHDLIDEGMDRDAAILAALDEFGDANVLAKDLTEPRKRLHRRRLMQTSFATLATAAVIATGFFYFLPTQTRTGQPMIPQAAAQNGESTAATNTETLEPAAEADLLEQHISVNFEDSPLDAVLESLQKQVGLNVFVDWNSLEKIDVMRDTTVNMDLEDVRAEAVLRLLIESVGQGYLDYELRDNVLFIAQTSLLGEELLVIKTYDCTRLIELGEIVRNQWRVASTSKTHKDTNGVGELADMIREAMGGESAWIHGESLGLFAGVAVVRQTPTRHAQLREVLDNVTDRLEARVAIYEESSATESEPVPAYGGGAFGGNSTHSDTYGSGEYGEKSQVWNEAYEVTKRIAASQENINILRANIESLASTPKLSTEQVQTLDQVRQMLKQQQQLVQRKLTQRRTIITDAEYERLAAQFPVNSPGPRR